MEMKRTWAHLAQSTRNNYEYARRRRTLSPRIRRAIELYETAACPTKKAAAEAVGLDKASLYIAARNSPVAQEYAQALSGSVRDRVVDLSAVIERVSEKALEKIEHLIDNAGKEDVQLRASQDILDRNPKTSKTSRVTVDKLSLTGRDVEALMRALKDGPSLKAEFPAAAIGDYTPALEGETSALRDSQD